MKPERWQQIEQLYHAALERGTNERSDFLTEACAGDDALRREVESLLAYEEQSEDFIEAPALEVTAKVLARERAVAMAAGEMIKQYRIIEPLGAGGMGEVYLAEDTRLDRKVALKFLPAHLTQDQTHLHRFQQEARAVAALSHPNVCAIHEVAETNEGRHCIVMEYVDGVTLRERIVEARMTTGDALEVAIQVASALSAAHAAGIVHRDIKLENIMLRRDGYVKVLDFGLAKLAEPKSRAFDHEGETQMREMKTSPGMVLGTVAYMSPEQARGLPVDSRTDIWSLGVVLFEMITGQKPFAGATPTDVIISIVERNPALTSYMPKVPSKLEKLINKALAKNRDERYQTAESLLSDLKNLRQDVGAVPTAEHPVDGIARPQPAVATSRFEAFTTRFVPLWLRQRRILTATMLVAAVVIAGVLFALFTRPGRSTTPAPDIKSLAVLPLKNVTDDRNQDYFADGITEALIADISRIERLHVMSRTAVMGYKTTSQSPAEIGRDLKVDAVVTGAVARRGDRMHVNLQLTHVATGQNLWSGEYDRDLGEVMTLRDDVSLKIAARIGLKAPASQAEANRSSVNAEAYDQYLRGQFYLYSQNEADNKTAIAALEKSVSVDPNFAAAHAELAQAYVWRLFLFAPGEKELEEKAFAEIRRALALDSNSAVAYLARGRLLWTPNNKFPHDRAIKEYRHALTLNPSLDEARNQLALVYSHIGAFDEALQESQLALTGDPNNHLAQFRIAETLSFQSRYEEALSALRAIPRDVNPVLVGYQTAWSLFNLGRKAEASSTLAQLLKDHPDRGGIFTSIQAVLAASAGQPGVAEEKIKLAIARGKGFGHFHHTAYHIACAYALMKKPDEGIKWLQEAADGGFPCYPLFERDTNLNNLRQDGRFATLLARVKEQAQQYRK
jgi:eukaryotic-like serine/threonine-protein kinase